MRSLIADLDGIVWEADAATMAFTFVSEGVHDLLGYTPQEWLAEPSFWADRLHPEDRREVVARFVRTAARGGRFDLTYRLLARDGGWVWVRDLGHAVTDTDGTPALLRGLIVEITGQKALEEEVLDAEARFRRVVERLPAIVYLEAVRTDPGAPGQLLYVSPQVESILGFTPDEWMHDPVAWARQFHPEDRERARREYERVEREGGPLRIEYRMYTRAGDVRWFRDEAVLVRDETGDPRYWQGIMLDVTLEHELREREREQEQRYRSLVELIPAIVYRIDAADPTLQTVYVSPRVAAATGVTAAAWLADRTLWIRLVHPDDRDRVREEHARARGAGEGLAIEYRVVAVDGSVVWVRDEAEPVADETGTVRWWQGVVLDITGRKEAEAQLTEAEERYRALIEQSPAIVYIDPVEEGPTIYMSPQVETVLGYPPVEWYADPDLWSKVVHPDDRGTLRVIATDDARTSSTYRMIAKDGHTVWVTDRSTLLVDDEGVPRYWQGVLVDVTEQQRREELEADLERERLEGERLRAEDEMKTTFLQAVSHDLRTPLAAILGLAVTLEREDLELTGDEERDMARRIATNARKLDRIVGDFLDLERLSRGVARPELSPVDVGALVEEIATTTDLVGGRHLDLDVASLVVPADAAMLERIVENLLVNAGRHTPADARIWVRLERTDDGALLVVEDDGPGVAPEDRERIFEPFRQARGSGGGSGVGLALVARFAALHGGRAWVEERPGGGASFRVLLAWSPPVDQPTAAGSSAASQA
jgi:PAS domain S-box-containing protein